MGLVLNHEHSWNQAFRASSPQPSISTPITEVVRRHVMFRTAFCRLDLDGSRNGGEEAKTDWFAHFSAAVIGEDVFKEMRLELQMQATAWLNS